MLHGLARQPNTTHNICCQDDGLATIWDLAAPAGNAKQLELSGLNIDAVTDVRAGGAGGGAGANNQVATAGLDGCVRFYAA